MIPCVYSKMFSEGVYFSDNSHRDLIAFFCSISIFSYLEITLLTFASSIGYDLLYAIDIIAPAVDLPIPGKRINSSNFFGNLFLNSFLIISLVLKIFFALL